MRKSTEFGYYLRRLEHLERYHKYLKEKVDQALPQLTKLFQRVAALEKQLDASKKTKK